METEFDLDDLIVMAKKLSPSEAAFKLVLAELLICSHFNQLASFDGGFVGWLRWPDSMKESIKRGEYPLDKLDKNGSILQIVSLYAPRLAIKATRWLTRIPGVKLVCGNTANRWREVICPSY